MTKNLKALLEKRNTLVAEMNGMVESVEEETRSFDDVEVSRLAEIRSEVTSIDATIEQVKEIRGLSVADENIDFKGDNTVAEKVENTEVFETRGLEDYLRGRQSEELRALTDATTLGNATENTAGNGGVTVPTGVHSEIIRKLEEESPVFAAVRKFGSVTGNLKIARETSNDDEGFIGETLDATKIRPSLKTVTLNQKRVGAATQLTNQLINDSGVDIVGYTNERLSRSVGRAIERGILLGAKVGEEADQTFRPITKDADIVAKETELAGAVPTVEELLAVYTTLNPAYLDGSMWIVSRAVFNGILALKDGDGTYLVFRDIVNGKPGYTLFGCPVHVTNILTDDETGIVFGNLNQAYGMLVKKGMNLTTVTADTTQALAGGRLAVLDAYMDGAVINPDAVQIAKVTTP